MDALKTLIDLFVNLDEHLRTAVDTFGPWTYVLLFVIIFCETGLVITPFLPGDSLLFAAGALVVLAPETLGLGTTLLLLTLAAILGDTVNYWIGRWIGPKAFSGRLPLLRKEHLDQTQAFYKRHGGKTIILARFVPIVRTFAPFVAGIGAMNYATFILYNIIGAVVWVMACVMAGYLFGNIPVVKKNFELFMIGIVLVSVLPVAIEFFRHRRQARNASALQPSIATTDPLQTEDATL